MLLLFFKYHLLTELIYVFSALVVLLFGIYVEKIDDWDKKRTKTELSVPMQKRRKKAIKAIRIIAVAIAIYVFVEAIPIMMDIPSIVQGEYRTAIGTVEEIKKVEDNRFKVRLDDEEEWYEVNIDRIELEDLVTLAYLPHSKKAVVIEINGENLLNISEE